MADKKRCTRCIMDTVVDPQISFNEENGVCCHCLRYDLLIETRVSRGKDAEEKLNSLVKKIKGAGIGRDYDCIIGVSGGVDSTYVAYLTKELGLRPLAIHFDNGWNSELAVKNMESVLKKLDIDLITFVIDWPEFKDLQLSFLKGSVPDGEVPSDHAIQSVLWRYAEKYNIKHIISGMNFVTESISVPHWSYGHSDWKYIKSVHKKFGTRKLKSYPHYSLPYLMYVNLKGIRTVSILNYIDFNKSDVMELLAEKLDWKSYGGKHHESIYTRFYQGYILPKKFSVDKRYGHLSDLINAGQITKEKALEEVASEPYNLDLQNQDLEYVCKKLSLTKQEFDEIMTSEVRSFNDYPNSYGLVQFLRGSVNMLRKLGVYPK
mgnify:CR=1 FL=1